MAKRQSEFLWDDSPVEGEFVLWCDERHAGRIAALEGVASMIQWHSRPCYSIVFDPRYGAEVIDEIEAITEGGD